MRRPHFLLVLGALGSVLADSLAKTPRDPSAGDVSERPLPRDDRQEKSNARGGGLVGLLLGRTCEHEVNCDLAEEHCPGLTTTETETCTVTETEVQTSTTTETCTVTETEVQVSTTTVTSLKTKTKVSTSTVRETEISTSTLTETEVSTSTVKETEVSTSTLTETEVSTSTVKETEVSTSTLTQWETADGATITVPQTISVEKTITSYIKLTVTIPGETQTVTLPGETETITLPGGSEIITLPGETETVTLPGETETITLPGGSETITLPGETETVTLPGETETITIPGGAETVTLPGEAETVTLPGEIETVTIPGETETVTVVITSYIERTITTTGPTATPPTTTAHEICPAPTNPIGSYAVFNPKSDLTWGCKPGFVCNPPKPDGCRLWADSPEDEFVCDPRHCIPAPEVCEVEWPENKTSYYKLTDGYFNLDPRAFGLSYDIFDPPTLIVTKINGKKTTITQGNYQSQSSLTHYPPEHTHQNAPSPAPTHYRLVKKAAPHRLYRRDGTIYPEVCFADCNNAYIETQEQGKTDALCAADSAFRENLALCNGCVARYDRETPTSERTYLEQKFAQFIAFCDGTAGQPTGGGEQPQPGVTSEPEVVTRSQGEINTSTDPVVITPTEPTSPPVETTPTEPTSPPVETESPPIESPTTPPAQSPSSPPGESPSSPPGESPSSDVVPGQPSRSREPPVSPSRPPLPSSPNQPGGGDRTAEAEPSAVSSAHAAPGDDDDGAEPSDPGSSPGGEGSPRPTQGGAGDPEASGPPIQEAVGSLILPSVVSFVLPLLGALLLV